MKAALHISVVEIAAGHTGEPRLLRHIGELRLSGHTGELGNPVQLLETWSR